MWIMSQQQRQVFRIWSKSISELADSLASSSIREREQSESSIAAWVTLIQSFTPTLYRINMKRENCWQCARRTKWLESYVLVSRAKVIIYIPGWAGNMSAFSFRICSLCLLLCTAVHRLKCIFNRRQMQNSWIANTCRLAEMPTQSLLIKPKPKPTFTF